MSQLRWGTGNGWAVLMSQLRWGTGNGCAVPRES
jgi:hypothetical protein